MAPQWKRKEVTKLIMSWVHNEPIPQWDEFLSPSLFVKVITNNDKMIIKMPKYCYVTYFLSQNTKYEKRKTYTIGSTFSI
jgi:hypothetical protein